MKLTDKSKKMNIFVSIALLDIVLLCFHSGMAACQRDRVVQVAQKLQPWSTVQ